MDDKGVWALLDRQAGVARRLINQETVVVDTVGPVDPDDLFTQVPKWLRYKSVVAVFADLVGSTQLAAGGMWEKSTAAIYDASVGPMAEILSIHDADFIDIQGDGGFAVFTGADAKQKAICAAITISTFSESLLQPILTQRWGERAPQTGFRVGVATSDVLVKNVGVPRTAHKAPVWAGRAVNYAAKCSQQAPRHKVLVTGPIADFVRGNDYLLFSCGCQNGVPGSPPSRLWDEFRIRHVAEQHADGLLLRSTWCKSCGDEFRSAVLAGTSRRPECSRDRARETQSMRYGR